MSIAVVVSAALPLWAQPARPPDVPKTAGELKREAKRAEKSGKVVDAYLLYAQAAAVSPRDPKVWGRSVALRRRALMETQIGTPGATVAPPDAEQEHDARIPAAELMAAREFRPPLKLRPDAGDRDFDLRGDSRAVSEQVLKGFGIDAIFDGDYQPLQNIRFRLEKAGFRETLQAMEAATNSFVVPVTDRVALVSRDTPQKRSELEHTMAVTVPLPHPVTVQEAQEAARVVQQAMEIQKFQVDGVRRLALIRDRAGKVEPALALYHQLLQYKPEVEVEIDLMEMSEQKTNRYGLGLPTSFPMYWLSQLKPFRADLPSNLSNLLIFGGGSTVFGLGISGALLFATMSESQARTVFRTQLRGSDGQAINFHVGDKYPIITAGYYGQTTPPPSGAKVYTPPPTINFEDLGLVIKITPRVHDAGEVSMNIEAEFKVLTGQALNGIPVISNRKFAVNARLATNDYAIIAGLVTASEARMISGLAGVSQVPLLGPLIRENEKTKDERQELVVLKPRVISATQAEVAYREVWTGTESRPRSPFP